MTRIVRLFLFSAAIVGIVLVLFLFLDASLLNTYILNHITESASSSSVRITGNGLSLLFIGMRIATLRITLAKFFLSLLVNDISMNCLSPSLFVGSPRCILDGSAYEGKLEGELSISRSGTIIHHASIQGLSLSKHPQFLAMGIARGTMDLTTEDMEIVPEGIKNSVTVLNIKNMSIPHPVTLNTRFTGFPMRINVPEITIESLSARFDHNNTVKDIALSSSFGEINGSIDLGEAKHIHLVLSLSQRGVEQLRPYLQFICAKNILDSPEKILLDGSFQTLHCLPAPM